MFMTLIERRICDLWFYYELSDPSASTETILQLVQDDTGATGEQQIAALEKLSALHERGEKVTSIDFSKV